MAFKFEGLDVWQLALAYVDLSYQIAEQLPRSEEHHLKSQLLRAATSVALNIAEGSTGQTDAEQGRFLGMAIRSLPETVACQQIIRRRQLLQDFARLDQAYHEAEMLAKKLTALRKAVAPQQTWVREEPTGYLVDAAQEPTS